MVTIHPENLVKDNTSLSYKEDREWLMLLKQNNAEEVEKILENSSQEEKDRLVNGKFLLPDHTANDDEIENNFDDYDYSLNDTQDPRLLLAQHPWCIAAIHGANDVLDALIRCVFLTFY